MATSRLRLVALAVLVVAVVLAYPSARKEVDGYRSIQEHRNQLASEIAACKTRLKAFHQAWALYRKDHHGQEPPSFAALMPKYIASPEMLVCPTARRLDTEKKGYDRGVVSFNGKDYPETYGFRWLTGANAVEVKRHKDAAPLIVCSTHHEAICRYIFHAEPNTFHPSFIQAAALQSSGLDWEPLVITRKGDITTQSDQ